MTRQTVLIAGATGVVGHAAMHEFATMADIDLVVLSRRPPDLPATPRARLTHLALDLTDAGACRAQLATIGPVTQLVYGALYEKPGLVAGWRDPEQMSVNLAMLRNLLDPLAARGSLRHASILQGTKAYGVHLHPVPVPARESQPRDQHDNFYWLQEDHLRAQAAQHGFDFTIWRPQLIFGDVVGVAMNLMPVIGIYAALCRQQGLAFAYPGGQTNLLEAVDARLLARALRWASDAPAARGQTFNITNGDVFAWRNVWPAIADALGMVPGEDERRCLAQWLPTQADAWQQLVTRHGLRNQPLQAMLGESHHYADFCFGYYARSTPPPVLVSTIKLRQAGFGDCIDTEQMFRDGFARLQQMKVLPPR